MKLVNHWTADVVESLVVVVIGFLLSCHRPAGTSHGDEEPGNSVVLANSTAELEQYSEAVFYKKVYYHKKVVMRGMGKSWANFRLAQFAIPNSHPPKWDWELS